ncbi:MAG TPA: sigma-70 family RNA polymerase sigma factor, partial [Tepidisphaeraceae bacterium]
KEQVTRSGNFTLVDEAERLEILRRASRLGMQCDSQEISRRIGRKLNRSPLTILHTIRKHDHEHPEQSILDRAAAALDEEQRGALLRKYRRGAGIKQLARSAGRSRATVYRAVVDERIARINKRRIKFIDDSLYHAENAGEAIEEILRQDALGEATSIEQMRIPRDLPPYLQELYRIPLLTPSRERGLFLKFNFHKFEFVTARRRLDPQFAGRRDLDFLERLLRRAADAKNQIVKANLRLVVSIAKKHLRPGVNLMELISDGNITLMRAVDGFDIHRGNRFSTYATLALMKGFARSVPMMLAARRGGACDHRMLLEVADSRHTASPERAAERDDLRHLLSRLSERERHVLGAHYGLEESIPASYEQVALRLGLSKQRVRQIEQQALAKLRAVAGAQ